MIDVATFTTDLNKFLASYSLNTVGMSASEILAQLKIAKNVAAYARNAMGIWTQIQSGTEGNA